MKYTQFAQGLWEDDTFLTHSPEQKIISFYLLTAPGKNLAGIRDMGFKMASNAVGMTLESFKSALNGLMETFPDWYMYDAATNEFALIQYPKWMHAGIKGLAAKILSQDIAKIRSLPILKAILSNNPTSIAAEYLAQFRRLNIAVQRAKIMPELPLESEKTPFSIGGAQLSENQEEDILNINLNINNTINSIGTESTQPSDVLKILPKGKKSKKLCAAAAPPPTVEEVTAYAVEVLTKKRAQISKTVTQPEFKDVELWAGDFAARFVSYYSAEARDWKQSNGRPLVSWKAAVTGTWSDTLYHLLFSGKAYRAYGVQQQYGKQLPAIVAPAYSRRV